MFSWTAVVIFYAGPYFIPSDFSSIVFIVSNTSISISSFWKNSKRCSKFSLVIVMQQFGLSLDKINLGWKYFQMKELLMIL